MKRNESYHLPPIPPLSIPKASKASAVIIQKTKLKLYVVVENYFVVVVISLLGICRNNTVNNILKIISKRHLTDWLCSRKLSC